MKIWTFEEWNSSFRETGLPLEFYGKTEWGHQTDKSIIDMGITKLKIINTESNNSLSFSSAPSKIVHALFFSNPQHIRFSIAQLDDEFFILCPNIPPQTAELLRNHGLMFADQRGNSFVSWNGVHIDVRGKANTASSKLKRHFTTERRTASLFTPRRAQVSGALLSQPTLLRSPIREIADSALVSSGTAIQTLDLLTQAGYLHKSESGEYRLIKAEALIDAWAHAYPTGLGLNRQTFKGTGDLDRLKDLKPLGWISGEQAIPELISGGNTAHIYVKDEDETKKLIQNARLRRDDVEGQVTVRLAFWHQPVEQIEKINRNNLQATNHGPFNRWPRAPLLAIYADLLSVGDPRLTEVAQIIKTKIKEQTHNDQSSARGRYFNR